MSPERQHPENIQDENNVSISRNVYDAIDTAMSNFPQQRASMDQVDLMYAIMQGEGKGTQILKNLAYSKRQTLAQVMQKRIFEIPSEEPESLGIQVNDLTLNWSVALIQLVKNASKLAQSRIITTEDILLADAANEFSILQQLLDESQIMYSGSSDPRSRVAYIKSIASRIANEADTEGYTLSFTPKEPEPLITKPYFTEDIVPAISYTSESGAVANPEIVDLIAESKKTEESPFIRKEQVAQLLRIIQSKELAVLVTNNRQDADHIVNGLAHELAQDEQSIFDHQNMIVIDPVVLAQNPVRAITQASQRAKNGILFLPNIQEYLASGSNQNIGSTLRAAIEHASTKTITTMTEYQWHRVYKTSDFEHAGVMFVEPPDEKEALEMMQEQKSQLEAKLSGKNMPLTLSTNTLEVAVSLAARELRADASILEGVMLLLQTAATSLKIQSSSMHSLHDSRINTDHSIDPEDIAIALEKITGKPAEVDNPEKYLQMEEVIGKEIIGQNEAIEQISDAIRRAKAGLKDPKKPIGSFMFLGPTTVGKTELARQLASFMNLELIKIDMSEYSEKHQVSRLYGAPPGYAGYEEGGQLTEALRRNPYSIVLFDELEKAHPDVWNSLLQITRDGTLTDGHGRVIKFNNAVIIATGNVGASHYNQLIDSATLSSDDRKELRSRVDDDVMEEVRKTFKPELLNRFDSIIKFNNLELHHIEEIVTLQFEELNVLLNERGINAKLSDRAKRFLAEQSFSPAEGAGPVKRQLRQYIESPLSRKLLQNAFVAGDEVTIDVTDKNEIIFLH